MSSSTTKNSRTNKIRLLILTDYFHPHWTGICKSLYYLLQLMQNELASTVLTTQFRNDLARKEKLLGTTILREPPLFTISRAKYSLSTLVRLLSIIRQYSAVLINSPYTNVLPAALIAKLFGKRLLVLHQADFILPQGAINRVLEFVYYACSLVGFALADRVATWNRDYARHSPVLKPFLHKFTSLRLPIVLPKSKPVVHANIQKLRTLKQSSKILLGFAGRFVEEKGFDILFEAIPMIVSRHPNVIFAYAGETNLFYENFFAKNIEKYNRVKNYIIETGLLDENALIHFYQTLDFLVVPSRSDAFPLVQAEAAYCGVPLLTADIPGARTLIQDTGFGILFEKENPHALAEAVSLAIRTRAQIMKHTRNVRSYFDPQKTHKQLLSFIAGVDVTD